MSVSRRFFDTNLLLYLLSADASKADTAEREISAGGVISVQVLNEFSAVATGKLAMSIAEVREILSVVRSVCEVRPIGLDAHDLGLQIVEKYRYSIYDSIIVASALLAQCDELITEDLQSGQKLEERLTIRNPFN
jgi:predicted nucleic acid-binding protein